jgi:hypothetical protein
MTDPICHICDRDAEIVFHALWACPATEDVWGASKSNFQKCFFFRFDFTQVAKNILQRKGNEEFISSLCLALKICFEEIRLYMKGFLPTRTS